MRRRSFLTGGAAVAALAITPIMCPAADTAAPQTWTLFRASNRYVVRLRGAALTVDCYAAGDTLDCERGELPPDTPAKAAMLVAGGEETAVSWRVGTWHQADALTLRLALVADDFPLVADVDFDIDAATGLLRRKTLIRFCGTDADVDIAATLGFWFGIHEPIDDMRYLAGAWAQETQLRHGRGEAQLRLESRAGKTGFAFQPYIALHAGAATYLCQMFWSGNWAMQATPTVGGAVVSGGLNDWRFRCRLGPTGTLPLPTVLFGRFEGDLNAATQRLHDYRRAQRPDPARIIPVQFNSWYPYLGEPSADAMLPLVPAAKRLGCEAFVIDSGWFRTDDGDSDAAWEARTGDWRTSRRRFPNGLREIGARCREHGLKFGLWFEPEVIGRLSAIRHEHPEWLHHIDGRPPTDDARAVLNLGVPAALQHAFERVTRILSTVDVDWMKWDFNADLGAGGWAPGLPAALTDQDPLVAHYRGLYRLQDAIRRWFPELVLEMCASGGGRMDGELLSHSHVNWISDQPGPLRKLAIHVGSQLAHPAVVCNDWLIEWPPGSIAGYDDKDAAEGLDERGDLPFRLRVAMLGSFGISARIDRWPEADCATVATHIALYRDKLRAIIHHGDQYLLTKAPPPDGNGDWVALWYAAKDRARGVLFSFRLGSSDGARVFRLPGLRAERRYRCTPCGGLVAEATGAALASGLAVSIGAPFRSELHVIEAV